MAQEPPLLILIARYGTVPAGLLEKFLEAGADLNLSPHGYSPLGEALIRNNWDTVEMLIRYGANPMGFKSSLGLSILHFFALSRAPVTQRLCRALIDAGADVNARMQYGATPLYFAVQGQHWDRVRWLLAAGARAKGSMENRPRHFPGSTVMHAFAKCRRGPPDWAVFAL
jgi:ankyrin repeat protein